MAGRDETDDILSTVLKLVARDRTDLKGSSADATTLLLDADRRVDTASPEAGNGAEDGPPPLLIGDDMRVIAPAETIPDGYAEDADYEFFGTSAAQPWDHPENVAKLRELVGEMVHAALASPADDDVGQAIRALIREELQTLLTLGGSR